MSPQRPARGLAALAAAAALVLGPPALAQDDTVPSEPDPANNVLRGPSVPDDATRTLLRQGMTRGFVPVEGRPEIAALQLLELDPETSERLADAISQRTIDVSILLVDRIDTVREITDEITAGGDAERIRQLQISMWDEFEPDRPRDPLLDQLADTLTPEQRAEATRLLDEYWSAWIDSELNDGPDLEGERLAAARERTEQRLKFGLFQQELREAYDVSLSRYRQAMEAIYNAVDPTPEQREAIRSLVIQHIKDTRLEATPEQRRAATRRIYDLLDEDRRALLFDYILQVALPG